MSMPKEALGTECNKCGKWKPWLQLFVLNNIERRVCGECYEVVGGKFGPEGFYLSWRGKWMKSIGG